MSIFKFSFVAVVFLLCFPAISFAQALAKYEPAGDAVYHGAGLPDYWDDAQLQRQLHQFQSHAGKRLAVVTWFSSLYENGRMTSWRQNYAANLHRIKRLKSVSLIKFSVQDHAYERTRQMANLQHITLGTFDAYFEEFANTVRDFGDPVFISINHEMNGTWYPYSAGYAGTNFTPEDYVASWRHIVNIFRKQGANNVAWVWAPNVPDVGADSHRDYYPGDDYVDWVGPSFYSGNPLEQLTPFYQIYAERKPFFITEWATALEKNRYHPSFPGEAQWVAAFFQALETRFPRVKAISWFQWDKEDGNHLLQRVPEQAAAYTAEVKSPRYIDDVGNLLSKPPGGVYVPPLRVVPREVVLKEPVPVVAPKASAPPRRIPLRERVRLENVRIERRVSFPAQIPEYYIGARR